MKRKKVVPRSQANRDVEDAVFYYLASRAPDAAMGFIDALEKAYLFLSRHPASGSMRVGTELNLPGLRSWHLRSYPFVVFYLEQPDHVDVWRVLHERRHLPRWLIDSDE